MGFQKVGFCRKVGCPGKIMGFYGKIPGFYGKILGFRNATRFSDIKNRLHSIRRPASFKVESQILIKTAKSYIPKN